MQVLFVNASIEMCIIVPYPTLTYPLSSYKLFKTPFSINCVTYYMMSFLVLICSLDQRCMPKPFKAEKVFLKQILNGIHERLIILIFKQYECTFFQISLLTE